MGAEGAEGTGGCESYSISEITNKYIYDAFLMIYLSTSLLFFHVMVPQRSESEINKGRNL